LVRFKFWLSIIAAAIIFTHVTDAGAEIRPGAFSLTPLLGGYTFEGKQELGDGTLFGFRLGYNFDERWGMEAAFDFIDTKFTFVDVGVDGFIFRLEGLYHLLPEKPLSPFLAAGIGGIDLRFENAGGSSGFLFGYGLGLKYSLSDTVSLRGDLRHILAYSDALSNFAYTFGVTFTFGGDKRASARKRIKDSDGDGVADSSDMCPDTPKNAPVNERGCPTDSDGDGVSDYLDKCAETPVGVPVNIDGCPADGDRDGVPDKLDRCPDTPEGLSVDSSGCSPSRRKKVSMMFNVEFDSNSTNVQEMYQLLLKRAAEFMKKYPGTMATIEGHTDSRGKAEFNLEISQKRADSVKRYLVENLGIDPSRVKAVGYGESRPVADNETRAGRERNRRVLVIITRPNP
jgi:OOP family OmpA-OmpF porin